MKLSDPAGQPTLCRLGVFEEDTAPASSIKVEADSREWTDRGHAYSVASLAAALGERNEEGFRHSAARSC
jgi:hypothetical protein